MRKNEGVKMDRNINYRANSGYIKKARQLTSTEQLFRFLWCLYQYVEKIVMTDAFAAGFCGVSFMLIIGIVGGIEFGTLSLKSGIIFSSVLISAVTLLLYKKNKE